MEAATWRIAEGYWDAYTYGCGISYVEDKNSRSVAQPMLPETRYACWSDAVGNAVVLRSETVGTATEFIRSRLNRRQNIVLYESVTIDPSGDQPISLAADYSGADRYVYCMVAEADSSPVILNREGTCLAGCTP